MIAQNDIQHYCPLSELMPPSWHAGDVQLADGTHIHYTRTGNGSQPAVLLLHGIQASGAMWLRTAQALSYDVIMPDFRGHGQSSRIDDAFSADVLVADTVALLDALGVKDVAVVGHSMGADIAGRLAAVYPARVRRVMLVDPALRNFAAAMQLKDGEIPLYMEAIFQTMRKMASASHAEKMALALRLLPPGTPLWAEADYVTFAEGMAQFDQSAYRFTSQMGYLCEAPTAVARIKAPILLLTARPMMGEVNIAPFANHWRSGEHIHFPDSGHFIPFDQFSRFIEALKAFLTV